MTVFFFVGVYILSGIWFVSPGYPTFAECWAAIVRETTAPEMQYEADNFIAPATSECYYQERSK